MSLPGTKAFVGIWLQHKDTPAPIVAIPEVQTSLPTSAYGQTIPVVWFKARLPSAYIWVAPILTVTETHQESGFWGIIQSTTSTTANMSARLRFARPLVPDSTWTLRKFYANGRLIYDATTGYRQDGLQFTAYDGRSTQLRDPTMVAEEGEENVSAHRGYLDIVVTDFDIVGLGAPPVFEAEWIQEASSVDIDNFTILLPTRLYTVPVVDWDSNTFYALDGDFWIRRFHIAGLREIYAIPISFNAFSYSDIDSGTIRLIPQLGCLLAFFQRSGGGLTWYAVLIDIETGAIVAEDTGGTIQFIQTGALCRFGSASVYVAHAHLGVLLIYLIKEESITRTLFTGGWEGYSEVPSMVFGAVRSNNADLWMCADNKLVKAVITSTGAISTTTEFATFATDLVYVLWHDGDLIVFTDDQQIIRVDGATGATVWTQAVPYQITASFPDPDLHRLDGVFFFQDVTSYSFTDLDTGLTTSIANPSGEVPKVVYDGRSNLTVNTHQLLAQPFRAFFDGSGDGTQGELTDFLTALMQAGGYDASEIAFEGVLDDMIDGSVIDITAGVRDIARSVCEPYSIAIFER
ncbi:hypothetical protein [Mesorhizobium kowhaii]|uniref:Uncharacterized protein n=1 Tax=Mesorhizobium kowhaii TaxID=1300272 RepID=A0A2W7C2W7_9HYPH|nr:hypothetical protein [Mesorhizobium kowhaii]PZV36158.1 hypothetical protein B5V02_23415 [Mesorhizobium kowhaii]